MKLKIMESSAWLKAAEERLYGNLESAKWRVIKEPRASYDSVETTVYQFHVKEVGYAEIEVALHHQFLDSSRGFIPKEFNVMTSVVNENHKSLGYHLPSLKEFYIEIYGKKPMTSAMKIYDDGWFSPVGIIVPASDKKAVDEFINFWKPLLEDYMRMVIEDKVARSNRD